MRLLTSRSGVRASLGAFALPGFVGLNVLLDFIYARKLQQGTWYVVARARMRLYSVESDSLLYVGTWYVVRARAREGDSLRSK